MDSKENELRGFRKKVYTKLTTSEITDQVSSSISQIGEAKGTRILATRVNSTLREELKRIFLPLLIDVFELRQSTQNLKNQSLSDSFDFSIADKSPEQIIANLEELQSQLKEAQNWCDGVLLQLSRGIDELHQVVDHIGQHQKEKETKKKKNFLKSIVDLFQTE